MTTSVFLNALRGQIEGIFRRLNRKAELSLFSASSALPAEQMAQCDMAFLDIDFDDGRKTPSTWPRGFAG